MRRETYSRLTSPACSSSWLRTRTPRWRSILCPSNVKFTSSMPWRSALAPNSDSAPGAPPLNRMPSSRFMYASPACAIIAFAMSTPGRRYRAGEAIEDFCRACKTDRMHTVVAADAEGKPIRVVCGFCESEHNYRGGPRIDTSAPEARPERPKVSAARGDREPFPIVSERERVAPLMSAEQIDIEMLLRRVIREESGISPVT